MKTTAKQLSILRHAIGYDDAGNDNYPNARSLDERRNRFVTGPGCADFTDCAELVGLGLMEDHGVQPAMGGDHYFTVTDAGRTVVLDNKPGAKRATRAQQQYQDFLNFDGSLTFIQYLRWSANLKKRGIA
jgi:hypothetical protein